MARAMSKSGRVAKVFAAGAMSVGLLVACGSSGGSGSSNNTPSPAAFNETTAKADITKNWEAFFDPTKPVSEKTALLQNASELQPVLEAQSQNPQAKSTKAKVKTVVIDPSHTSATVTYDLVPVQGGAALLAGSTGTSVYEAGVWKVSKASFCGLVALGASSNNTTPPPVCATA
jgi:hypothetical protein